MRQHFHKLRARKRRTYNNVYNNTECKLWMKCGNCCLFKISVIKVPFLYLCVRPARNHVILVWDKNAIFQFQSSFATFYVSFALSLSCSFDHWIHKMNSMIWPVKTWWKHEKWIPKIVVTFGYRTNLFCVFCGRKKKSYIHTHTRR